MGRPDPLSEKDKLEILKLRIEEQLSLKKLSLQFNCSVSHIHKTLNRLSKIEEMVLKYVFQKITRHRKKNNTKVRHCLNVKNM